MNTHAKVERLDHLGVVAGVIKDLKLVELKNFYVLMMLKGRLNVVLAKANFMKF
jgi:hypothetical protein